VLELRIGTIGLAPFRASQNALEPFELDATRLEDGLRVRGELVFGMGRSRSLLIGFPEEYEEATGSGRDPALSRGTPIMLATGRIRT